MQGKWLLAGCLWLLSQTTYSASDAKLAIIIDDIGYSAPLSERAARLKGDFTLSILPFTPHGNTAAQAGRQMGKELMLHIPMSNIGHLPLGAGGLYGTMNKEQLLHVLRQDLDSLNAIKGVNNHMGSQLTQEPEPMQWVMEELRARGLYFVDSRTSAKTKALNIAQTMGVASTKRDVFLDDVQGINEIKRELNRAIVLAKQRGNAVAIGHPYATTLQVLEQIQPLLSAQQVRLVFASQLLSTTTKPIIPAKPEPSSGFCPAPETPTIFEIITQLNQELISNNPQMTDFLE